MSIISSSLPIVGTVGIGIGCGVADFLYKSTAQKLCMLAGVTFEEIADEDGTLETPASERLNKDFKDFVVLYPVGEELFFRGLLQPALAQAIVLASPELAAPGMLGIPSANLMSSAIIGVGFGAVHYFCYEKGGVAVATIGSVSGMFFGMIKETTGLVGSISAHMVTNLCTGLLDKFYPTFLESNQEREIRIKQA